MVMLCHPFCLWILLMIRCCDTFFLYFWLKSYQLLLAEVRIDSCASCKKLIMNDVLSIPLCTHHCVLIRVPLQSMKLDYSFIMIFFARSYRKWSTFWQQWSITSKMNRFDFVWIENRKWIYNSLDFVTDRHTSCFL